MLQQITLSRIVLTAYDQSTRKNLLTPKSCRCCNKSGQTNRGSTSSLPASKPNCPEEPAVPDDVIDEGQGTRPGWLIYTTSQRRRGASVPPSLGFLATLTLVPLARSREKIPPFSLQARWKAQEQQGVAREIILQFEGRGGAPVFWGSADSLFADGSCHARERFPLLPLQGVKSPIW
jgi:hypothetical protein